MAANGGSKNSCSGNNSKKRDKTSKNSSKSAVTDTQVCSTQAFVHNCGICEEIIEENDELLVCDTCHKHMHGVCWDPDAPTQVLAYLTNAGTNACVRVFCAQCATVTDIAQKIDQRMDKLEERLESALRTLNDHSVGKSYAAVVQNQSAVAANQPTASPAAAPRTTECSQPANIQNEIAEALDQERRKRNIVVFNLPATQASDSTRVSALFEHITGNRPPSFHCRRIGKLAQGKTQPILVEFANEFDRHGILSSARNLKDLQAEYPRVSIAPDRTKR